MASTTTVAEGNTNGHVDLAEIKEPATNGGSPFAYELLHALEAIKVGDLHDRFCAGPLVEHLSTISQIFDQQAYSDTGGTLG